MTPEEKVALLKEAGVWDVIGYPGCIDKLFDLVAKHERNRHAWTQEHWTEYEHAIAAAAREAKPKKPEECAKGCPQLQVCDYCQKAEQAEQEPVYAFRRKGQDSFCTCDKQRYEELADKPNLFEVTTFYAAPVQPVEQEPVGNISLWHNHGYQNHNVEYYGALPDGLHQLYAAPVRTKDLTDDEIDGVLWIGGLTEKNIRKFARAVIAADREKNK